MDEKEWKERYIARMMSWGLSKVSAQKDCDVAFIDLTVEPEEAADDEISYMAEDAN
jgi:hypothetical protein